MKLTQEQIEEIRKRAEAATESQWFVMHDTDIMIEEPAGSGNTHSVAYSKASNDAEFIAIVPAETLKELSEDAES